jgi:hypothetical protein
MEVHSSVSRATTLQAGRPLSSGVLQLKPTANLKAVAQWGRNSTSSYAFMALYKMKQKKKVFYTSQNFIFKYKFTKLKKHCIYNKILSEKIPFFPYYP